MSVADTPTPPATSAKRRSSNRSGPSSRRVTWLQSSVFSRRFPYTHRRAARLQKGLKPLSPGPWAYPPRRGLHARGRCRARYLVQTPILQANRTELSPPDATRIEGEEVGRNAQAERRPVPAYHGVISAFPVRHLEPRKVAGGSFGHLALRVELHYALRGAKTQAGHCVDDDAQPVDPAQLVVPAIRARTVELREKFLVPGPAQFRLDFSSKGFGR